MSTYSPSLRAELISTGTQAGTWGSTTNDNFSTVFDTAIAGYISVSVTSANQALTYVNGPTATAAANQSIRAAINLTTTTAADFAVYAPPVSKLYVIKNASSYTTTIYNSTVIGNTTAAGTGVAIPAGKTMAVWSDGTNFTQQINHLINPTLVSPTMTTPTLGTPTSGTLTNCTDLPVSTGVSGLGVGVATFLTTPSSANLAAALTDETGTGSAVFANSPTLVTPNLGTPSAATLTNATGLPISTGVSGLGAGVATFLATPSSTNLAAAVTGETGTGALVFGTSPTLVTPVLGTPTSGTLTNCTGLPISTGVSGLGANVATFLATPSSANLAAALTDETGTGSAVFATSPTLVTPNLGTPSAINLTNATNIPTNQFTGGAVPVSAGGTGATTLTNAALLRGNGTSAISAASAADIVAAIGATAVANATTSANCTALVGLGFGGTIWRDVTGSRATYTTYTNNRSYPIFVSWWSDGSTGGNNYAVAYVSGSPVASNTGAASVGWRGGLQFVVPPSASYGVWANSGVSGWWELY